jgi:putative ABC transport system permease protein
MRMVLYDLRIAIRSLKRNPGFTAALIVTFALGIGANTAVFTVANAALLQPLPYRDPERLVAIRVSTNYEIVLIRSQSRTLESVAAYHPTALSLLDGEPEIIDGYRVSSGFFELLGVRPAFGRTFAKDEHMVHGAPVIIISDHFWKRRFGGDPGVIGRTLRIGGSLEATDPGPELASVTVIGVMPPGFEFPIQRFGTIRMDFWKPYDIDPNKFDRVVASVIGRLKAETSFGAARAELPTLFDLVRRHYPDRFPADVQPANWGKNIRLLSEEFFATQPSQQLFLLQGIVAFVLLIAVANAVNLTFSRILDRHAETVIRAALGASRWQLARPLFAESLLVAAAGGVVGFLLAYCIPRPVFSMVLPDLARMDSAQPDAIVLGFTLLLTLVVGGITALVPALVDTHDLGEAIKGSPGSPLFARRSHRPLPAALAALEVALAIVLIVGGALLLRSFWLLTSVPLGFKAERVFIIQNARSLLVRYPYDRVRWTHYYETVLERIKSLPGVTAVAVVEPVVLFRSVSLNFTPIKTDGDRKERVTECQITPEYFETLSIPLLRGRLLTRHDRNVAVISESMARRIWPGEDPIGKEVLRAWFTNRAARFTIVGVVADTRLQRAISFDPDPTMYTPFIAYRPGAILLRDNGNAGSVAPLVHKVLREIDPSLASSLEPLESVLYGSLATPRVRSILLALFATVALTLAVVGVYGVLSYSVGRRTREIGIRMALGAERSAILKMIIRQGMMVVLTGVAFGTAAAWGMSRFLSGMLFGITPRDPLSLGIGVTVAVVASLPACLLPAYRAVRVDPLRALRWE